MIERTEHGAKIFVKVVPNASIDQIVGEVGGRLKVRVSSPPESGKANRSVCQLLSRALGVKKNTVSVLSGSTNPKKIIGIRGVSVDTIWSKLGL